MSQEASASSALDEAEGQLLQLTLGIGAVRGFIAGPARTNAELKK